MTERGGGAKSFSAKKVEFEQWLRRRSQLVLQPIAGALGRLGLSPNMLTIIGVGLNVLVAVILGSGSLALGGLLLLLSSSFDALDGTLARLTGQQSAFGAFFDSTLDRYSEAIVYGGLLYYFIEQGASPEPFLVYAAIIGSLMVSYARARAEGIGAECKVGLLTRAERMLVLAAGLIFGLLTPALWVVAVLSNVTALQRILYVRRVTEASVES
jgi:CDP-diacylglycerol--glycerol-3-phosphate 3-phosphatidyltransferase